MLDSQMSVFYCCIKNLFIPSITCKRAYETQTKPIREYIMSDKSSHHSSYHLLLGKYCVALGCISPVILSGAIEPNIRQGIFYFIGQR